MNRDSINLRQKHRDAWLTYKEIGEITWDPVYSIQYHLKRKRDTRFKTVISLFDLHYPYNIDISWVLNFIKEVKPNEIIFGWDMIDCNWVSKFYRGSIEEWLAETVEEIKWFKEIILNIKDASPQSKLIYLLGNHEHRIQEKIANTPTVGAIIDLKIWYDWLIDVRKEYNDYYRVWDLHYIHWTYHNDAHAKKHALMYQKDIRYWHLHCFDSETEVLTDSWFKLFQDLDEDKDLVVTENLDEWKLELNKINEMVEYDNYTELIKIKTWHVDLMVTEDHWLINRTRKKPEKIKAGEIFNRVVRKFKTWWQITKEWIDLTDDEIRMVVQVVTDWYINWWKRVDFHLSKQRKIDRVCDLFTRNWVRVKKNIQRTWNTKMHLNLKDLKIAKYIEFWKKELPQEFRNMNKHQIDILLDEYSITDWHSYWNSIQLSTAKEQEADLIQELMITNWYRCNKTPKYVDWKKYFTISVYIKHQFNEFKSTKWQVTRVPYDWIVRCISVDNWTLLVRRKWKTCIVQNTTQEYALASPIDRRAITSKTIPCLSNLNPDYMKNKPSAWSNGFNIAYINNDWTFNDYNIIITDWSFIYNWKKY